MKKDLGRELYFVLFLSSSAHVGLVPVDETVGAAVMVADGSSILQLREDSISELLAKLDAPLVVAVDVPDDTLDEDLVLVHGDERAKSMGSQLGHHDGVGGMVALEDLVRKKSCNPLRGHTSLL